MIKYGWLIGLVISCTAIANATPLTSDANFIAVRTAQVFARARTNEDLLKSFQAPPKDAKAVQGALQEAGSYVSPQAVREEDGVVTLVMPGHDVIIDWRGVTEGHVEINQHRIQFTTDKNFLNYRSEVAFALEASPKSAAWSFVLPAAQAETPEWMKNLEFHLANILDDVRPGGGSDLAGMSEPVVNRRLAMDIVKAYEVDDAIYSNQANHYGPDRNDPFAPMVFRCEKGVLQSVGHLTKGSKVPQDGFVRTDAGTYAFKKDARAKSVPVDNNFLVKTTTRGFEKGRNLLFYMHADFGGFPKIAQECCVMSGCYEDVQKGIQGVLQHAAQTQSTKRNTSVQ